MNNKLLAYTTRRYNSINAMTMDKLEQIKNAVTANGMREWTDERVGQAMREYADQQNAELRERVKELESQLTKYRIALERVLQLLQACRPYTPGLGAPINIIKSLLEQEVRHEK